MIFSYFKLATIDNAPLLYDWRNDPLTRAMSLNTEIESFENHLLWLEKSLQNSLRKLYIYYQKDIPVGTIRLDTKEDFIEISWTIHPSFRGRGLGKEMVANFIQKHPDNYRAYVKKENRASQKICQMTGFQVIEEKENILLFQQKNTLL